MKTIKNILTGFAIALMILGGTALANQADSSAFSENTTYALPEEQYVNDIPFNTAKLAVEARYQKAIQVQFTVPEENDVNDIPSNVQKAVTHYQYKQAMSQVFSVPAEKDVNDIPFSTEKVFERLQAEKQLLTTLK